MILLWSTYIGDRKLKSIAAKPKIGLSDKVAGLSTGYRAEKAEDRGPDT